MTILAELTSSIDRTLATLELGIGLLGILLGFLMSRHFYRKSTLEKSVYVSATPAKSLIEHSSHEIPVEITYAGIPVQGVNRMWLLFWNLGRRALEKTDFISAPYVEMLSNDKLLRCVVDDRDPLVDVSTKQHENRSEIDISLLRPQDAFRICIDFEGEAKNVKVNALLKDNPPSPMLPIALRLDGITVFVLTGMGATIVTAYFLPPGGVSMKGELVASVLPYVFGAIVGGTCAFAKIVARRRLSRAALRFFKRETQVTPLGAL